MISTAMHALCRQVQPEKQADLQRAVTVTSLIPFLLLDFLLLDAEKNG